MVIFSRPGAPVAEAPARLPIDPRIRQRRIAVRRDEGRRRLRLLVAAVATVTLAGAGVAATHSALLDVDHVVLTGAAHTSRGDVLAAAGFDHHRFMVDVDGAAIGRRVRALPWVGRAQVARRWPGT
ncbi:MAG: FtsQ-type POTRA domain-containing protein, partial [Actinobacteria bacterium]|nr:FtsQ-type POTRA domain-containing protein [Actinomycetota bacterium]